MRCVGDGGDQARVNHGRTQTEKKGAHEPPVEMTWWPGQEQTRGLHPNAGDDQALAAPAIGEGARGDLQDAPGCRIDRLQQADAFDCKAEGREEQRKDSPAHSIIEVVDEPGLGSGKQVAIPKRGEEKYLAEADRSRLPRLARAPQPNT